MRRIIPIILSWLTLAAHAQEVNISMGEGYQSDVFVSLSEGEIQTVDATNWNLAFDVRNPFSVAVRVNDGHESTIKLYPQGDINAWESVDTTGFHNWPALHNLVDSWSNGALNQSYTDDPSDFSWGYYTGDPLHDVVGDSLYIVTSGDLAKKFRIDLLDNGVWTFTTADLDGSNQVETSINMFANAERNFVYFNAFTNTVIDREPANTSWDLVFTRYYGETAFGPGATAGVLANDGIALIKAEGINPADAYYADFTWTTDNIALIGNDWKYLNEMYQWEITPDLSYFVQTAGGDIYQITFTNFAGSATGDISYNATLISGANVEDLSAISEIKVFPNPSNASNINLSITSNLNTTASLEIYSLTGQLAAQQQVSLSVGSQRIHWETSYLTSGTYIVKVATDFGVDVRQLVIQ